MGFVANLLKWLMAANSLLLQIGRQIAWVALAIMVFVILLQVVFRYVFNNAQAWPEEAARFCMLWMTGLIAPSAMRWGGFVAIDMLLNALPKRLGLVLGFFLLCLSALVLVAAIPIGWNHTFGFGGNFNASAMRIPLDWFGGQAVLIKLRYMYGALLCGVILLFSVNVELLLRTFIGIVDPDRELPDDGNQIMAGAD